jgi:uncharacterized protein (TIGR03435 family)
MSSNLRAVLLLLALTVTAQTSKPRFEAASVKTTDVSERRTMFDTPPNGRFRAIGVNLQLLIARAYEIQLTQVAGGPAWVDADRFDIEAVVASTVPGLDGYRQTLSMLQSLLEERFKLAVHWETRQEPIYELVLARGGSRLKEATPGGAPPRQQMGRGQLMVTATPMSQLTPLLALLAKRQVVDKTGLTGVYDFTLTYALEAPGPDAPAPVDPNAPSIFTAVQEQLGLRLESARGPVNVLVIDRAEKPEVN